jgi:hypothetical protein
MRRNFENGAIIGKAMSSLEKCLEVVGFDGLLMWWKLKMWEGKITAADGFSTHRKFPSATTSWRSNSPTLKTLSLENACVVKSCSFPGAHCSLLKVIIFVRYSTPSTPFIHLFNPALYCEV